MALRTLRAVGLFDAKSVRCCFDRDSERRKGNRARQPGRDPRVGRPCRKFLFRADQDNRAEHILRQMIGDEDRPVAARNADSESRMAFDETAYPFCKSLVLKAKLDLDVSALIAGDFHKAITRECAAGQAIRSDQPCSSLD